jgi:hypothetical protein
MLLSTSGQARVQRAAALAFDIGIDYYTTQQSLTQGYTWCTGSCQRYPDHRGRSIVACSYCDRHSRPDEQRGKGVLLTVPHRQLTRNEDPRRDWPMHQGLLRDHRLYLDSSWLMQTNQALLKISTGIHLEAASPALRHRCL